MKFQTNRCMKRVSLYGVLQEVGKGMALLLAAAYAWPACSQIVVYRDPTHKSGEEDYIRITKDMINRINVSSAITTAAYALSADHMKQLERLKEQQYRGLTTSYAFYNDELRKRRFNESLAMIKDNLEQGLKVIDDNRYARDLLRDKLVDLIRSLDDADDIFRQATEVEGHEDQMSNTDRNILLFKAEDMLGEIAKQGQGLVNIGKMLTLDPIRMEQLEKKKYGTEN